MPLSKLAPLHCTAPHCAALCRLHAEEAGLDRMRQESASMAAGEAAALGGMRGQVGELQAMLNVSGSHRSGRGG